MEKVKFLVIGAGPTGIGACYRLKELGESDYLIVERENYVGGLAASFLDPQGFTWDIGGHVQFSHYDYFDRAMQDAIPDEGWLRHERESWVWIKQRFVPYPFQNNIRYLPKEALWSCLKGLIEIAASPNGHVKPANFAEWIQRSFGDGVAREFMLPYNYKVWAYPAEDLAYQWIGERVATVDLKRIMENVIFEKMDASWGPNNTFKFPLNGGTGAIWRSLARRIGLDRIQLNTAVLSIDAGRREALLSDGRTLRYDFILSTMPLDILTAMIEDVPQSIKTYARELKHSTSNIVGIGIHGKPPEQLKTKCWMYFPESDCPYYRMTMFSNYSPRNVPGPEYFSVMCETSESAKKPVNSARVIEETVQGLVANGFLEDPKRVVSRWSYTAAYGYPTPCLKRDQILSAVVPYLDKLEVFSRGRFGGWKYEVSNQDHTFMQGVEWVNRVVLGHDEKTYRVDSVRDPNLTVLKERVAPREESVRPASLSPRIFKKGGKTPSSMPSSDA